MSGVHPSTRPIVRRRLAWPAFAALALALAAAPAHAQLAELTAGTKVRVRAPSAVAGRLTGIVLTRGADSVTMSRENATPVTLPLSALTTLEISRGKSHGRGAWKGALWGGGIMFGLGLVVPAEECTGVGASRSCTRLSRGESAVFGAVGGATIGAVIGAIVGSERWERAALPMQVGVLPMSGGGVRVAVRWWR
jgi:hypothetical protein